MRAAARALVCAAAACGCTVEDPSRADDGAAPAAADDDDAPKPDVGAWLHWQPAATRDGEPAPAPRDPADVLVDEDGDGLDDAHEDFLARAYLPYLALHPDDECPRSGLLVRVRPHPADARFVHVVYVHLFDVDCGINGHVGDNEASGATIDPSLPPPDGIVALVAASHQNAFPCERETACGRCDGMAACATAERDGAAFPIVWYSRDKHGGYVEKGPCDFGSCFDVCADNPAPVVPRIVNAGEPGFPLTTNLTAAGLITADEGWSVDLMDHDPWAQGVEFGSAGETAGDLVDDAFVPPVCE